MSRHDVSQTISADTPAEEADADAAWRRVVGRRSFLRGVGTAGAAAMPASGLLAGSAFAASRKITKGDAAILRLVAAIELIEADLWQQYAELGGEDGGNPAYIAALANLDEDMPQYISDNTDDELSHAVPERLSPLEGRSAREPRRVSDAPEQQGHGARQTGRLTNLLSLNVDTSWYIRYRSDENPDFGATFPQAVTIRPSRRSRSTMPTRRRSARASPPVGIQETRMQAIANTAGFHFAMIEQGGSSLYSIMALKATSLEVTVRHERVRCPLVRPRRQWPSHHIRSERTGPGPDGRRRCIRLRVLRGRSGRPWRRPDLSRRSTGAGSAPSLPFRGPAPMCVQGHAAERRDRRWSVLQNLRFGESEG